MSDEAPRSLKAPLYAVGVRWVAALLGLGSVWFSLATLVLLNDHFGRISPARQIVVYGELPFRDFFDPGYFLTELSSAALLRLLGDNLLGEALLTTAFIAGGTVLVFLLSVRLTGSILVSLGAAVLALLSLPRAYDYDKVLFYPLGLLLCWRYIDRPGAGRLWAAAAGVVVAALFRYDTGVYMGAAMLVAMAVVHRGDWRTVTRRAALLLIAVACLALPFLSFIQVAGGGLANAVDQVVTYGRRETARTQLPAQRFSFGPLVRIGLSGTEDGARARGAPVRLLPGSWTRANADVLLTYLVRALPLVGVLLIVAAVRSGRASPVEVARLTSLVMLCVCLNIFILRDPVGARLGGMAGPAAILSAWIAHQSWHARRGRLRLAGRAALVPGLALVVWAVSASSVWAERLRPEMANPAHLGRVVDALAAPPPPLDAIANRNVVGLARYLRECTAPTDRVLATWFAPDLYFYAQRGFAARMVAVFGGHWSEARFARRSLEALDAQSTPIVVTRTRDERFEEDYPLLIRYLHEHYVVAGTSDFGDTDIGMGGYTVWARRDRQPARTYAATALPCF